MEIEEAHLLEFNQFNQQWDAKMNEFQEHAMQLEKAMQDKQEQDIRDLRANLDQTIPKEPKGSPELLNLRKIQVQLAKQKE